MQFREMIVEKNIKSLHREVSVSRKNNLVPSSRKTRAHIMFRKAVALFGFLALSEAQFSKYGIGPLQAPKGAAVEDIPIAGLGTWAITDPVQGVEAVARAMQNGFRHFDTAMIYKNEEIVGRGLAEGMRRTGLKREEFWVTTKLWNDR
jgi:hypothetical protein